MKKPQNTSRQLQIISDKGRYREYPGFLGIIALESCDSTNNFLKENYEKLKETLPVLITTSQQTGGRGRYNRTWDSKKDMGVYSSFGFYLETSIKLSLIPLAAGISVIDTLNDIKRIQCGFMSNAHGAAHKGISSRHTPGSGQGNLNPDSSIEFGLKWPNDILYKNRKISGVLIENTIFKDRILCITGIGINLNHTTDDFPGRLRDTAVSLRLITGKISKIEEVNKVLSHIFFSWLRKLKNNEEEEIIARANQYSSFLKGQPITFHQDNKITKGFYLGINRDGGMILENSRGDKKIYYSGEPHRVWER